MSSTHTYMISLSGDGLPETAGAELTAYFSDIPGDHEVHVLSPEPPAADSQALAYKAIVVVPHPKTLLRAELRVDGLDTVIHLPKPDGAESPALGAVSVETSVEQNSADDEGVDLVTTADPPSAAVASVAAEQTSSEEAGK
ncbi:hypothetical protein IWW39_001212 [Coemansia spiralis]|uniref:Uncharacterized protein n=1 Tax=Coemansia spiralis TaxID=417178 RepID=A0A9W8GQK6_9FUNG|nr:hypothetical protein IWW39_001212 [Coemansia spiralis]